MKERLEAFLADLVEVCQKHNMAIVEQGEYGIALIPWHGYADAERMHIITPQPLGLIRVQEITPDGTRNGDEPPDYLYESEGSL